MKEPHYTKYNKYKGMNILVCSYKGMEMRDVGYKPIIRFNYCPICGRELK